MIKRDFIEAGVFYAQAFRKNLREKGRRQDVKASECNINGIEMFKLNPEIVTYALSALPAGMKSMAKEMEANI